jgi:biotin carboxyl carrier protein
VSVHRVGEEVYLDSALGASHLLEKMRFPKPETLESPGSLLAPMPGTVTRIGARPGEVVVQGTAIVVLEAMKMEHVVQAPNDGTVVEMRVSVGESVDVGTLLCVLEPLTEVAG